MDGRETKHGMDGWEGCRSTDPFGMDETTGTSVQYPGHLTHGLYQQVFAAKGLSMDALRNSAQTEYSLGGDYRKLVSKTKTQGGRHGEQGGETWGTGGHGSACVSTVE